MKTPEQNREEIRKLAHWLDTRFQTPFGRVGWDGILGLIPGVGDLITGLLSLYVVVRAAAIGVSASVLLRMGGNIFVENVVDAIPLFGNFFDFFWRANTRNLALVDEYLQNPARTRRNSRWFVALVVLFIVGVAATLVAGGIYLLKLIYVAWQNASF